MYTPRLCFPIVCLTAKPVYCCNFRVSRDAAAQKGKLCLPGGCASHSLAAEVRNFVSCMFSRNSLLLCYLFTTHYVRIQIVAPVPARRILFFSCVCMRRSTSLHILVCPSSLALVFLLYLRQQYAPIVALVIVSKHLCVNSDGLSFDSNVCLSCNHICSQCLALMRSR